MTIASTTNRNNYLGNGSTATYAYGNYRIIADTDLLVTMRSPLGVETTLTRLTHYTVTGVGNVSGGNVVLVDGEFEWIDENGFLDTGYSITIRRVRSIKQLTDIRNQGSFYPETHEDALDNLCMIDQQQQDEIDRSVKLPETVDPADFDASMPTTLPANPGATFIVNATGDGFDLGPTASEIENAQANATAAAAAKTAAESAQTAAEAAQTASESAQTAAEAAQTAAESAETGAVSAQGSAESARDLAQNYADALKGTSVSSNSIGTGAKTFTTQTGKQFVAGQFVVVVDQASTANYMVGQVTSYSGSTLVIDSQSVGGSGTKTAWNIAITGSVGPTGSTGDTGTAGLNFLSGAGDPSDGTGVNNDMYLNTTNWDVYKKAAGTWGSPIGNIKGATGDTGATGASGDGKFNTATTTVKTDNYTVQATDFGNVLVMNSASAKAFTLPNITTASVIILKNIGAGVCTITPDASDTLETTSLTQNESAVLVSDVTNNAWRNVARSSGGGAWGSITGTLSSQTDLQNVLNEKASQGEVTTVKDSLSALAFKLAVHASLTVYNLVDWVIDEYQDQTGVDTASATGQAFDDANFCYSPGSYVATLLVHGDGSDNGTSFPDSSASNRTATRIGNAVTKTSTKKYGTASIYLDGSGDGVIYPDHADFEFGSGDFTMAFWVNLVQAPATNGAFPLLSKYEGAGSQRSFALGYKDTSGTKSIYLSAWADGSTLTSVFDIAQTLNTGTWYHIEVTRNGNSFRLFVNGTQVGSTATSSVSFYNSTASFQIGIANAITAPEDTLTNAYFDDVYVIKGIARHIANFTAPTGAYSATEYSNMYLPSIAFTAQSVPSEIRVLMREEDVDSITLNTDFIVSVSRDGGTTWTAATLAVEENLLSGGRLLGATVDVSGQPSGTSIKYKVETFNYKSFRNHAMSLAWK